MAKTIQVKLQFSGNTTQIKKQLADLQQQLSNLAATPITNNTSGLQNSLQSSINKAIELKVALHNATNVDTGKLNFGKFSQQLKQNKTTLEQYAASLQRLGPQGTEVFISLANAIRQSETPLISLQGKMATLGKTLANTIRWQISSSLIQSTMSAIGGVVDYAKELNESLNNIRIVTGKSEQEMAKFADQANKAAKALSTTTKEYTDASLIYYQQGLSSKEVRERTETTIKLANVTGESATTVSEWMTAIWNNFDDGSRSLENYADVLAKLGAATASSADEIAGGLEKFAAVADTVGLSYEYAASALATITAETRQSEDVVGTALKTILARVENLKLGETLEDGTTLGQYSAALEKVGVKITDASGNLRIMDDILVDIGKKWGMLEKAEQIALAQSVAGIRQYNQFIALMDNWDVMENNVKLSKEANGELQQQVLIYEQGIEGATARVQANLEEIKNTLLDENDLVPLLNVANGFLTVVGDLVDALGGLPGLLGIIGALALKIYGPQAAAGLQNMFSSLVVFKNALTGQTQVEKTDMAQRSTSLAADMALKNDDSQYGVAQSNILTTNANITNQLAEAEKKVSLEKKQQLELEYQILQVQQQQALEAAKKHKDSQDYNETLRTQIESSSPDMAKAIEDKKFADRAMIFGRASGFESAHYTTPEGVGDAATQIKDQLVASKNNFNADDLDKVKQSYSNLKKAIDDYTEAGTKLAKNEKTIQTLRAKGAKINSNEKKQLQDLEKEQKDLTKAQTRAEKRINKHRKTFAKNTKAASGYTKSLDELKGKYKDSEKKIEEYGDSLIDTGKKQEESNAEIQNGVKMAEDYQEGLKNINNSAAHWSQTVVGITSGLASMGAGIQMINGAFDTLTDSIANGEFSFSTFLSVLLSMVSAIPMVVTGYTQLANAIKQAKGAQDAEAVSGKKGALIKGVQTLASKLFKKAKKDETDEVEKDNTRQNKSNLLSALFGIGKQAGQGPKGWVTAAISAALLASIIGATVVSVKKNANTKEEQMEAADTRLEDTKETVEQHGEMYDSYTELYNTYKKTGEGREELAEQANKLAAAYGIEGAATAALTGNYDDLTRAINAARAAELQKMATDAQGAINAQTYSWDETARSGKGHKSGDGYIANFNDGGKSSDELAVVSAINTHIGKYTDVLNWNDEAGGGDLQLKLDNRGPADYAKAYEALEAIYSTATENGATSESELYTQIGEWISRNKENYDKWKQNKTTELQGTFGSKVLTTQSASGKYVGEITTAEDYATYREAVLEGTNTEEEKQAALTALGEQQNTAKFETMFRAIDEQSAKGAKELSEEKLKEAYLGASEAMIRAMASVEVTEGMTWDQFQKQAEDNLEDAARALKLDTASKYKISETQADTYTRVLKTYNKTLEENAYLLEMAANASIELNGELEELLKTWKDHSEALLLGNEDTVEYSVALSSVATSLAKTLGTEADLTNFVHTNKNLVAQFLNGNLELFDNIQLMVAQTVANTYTDVQGLDILFTMIGDKDYAIGDQINITPWLDKINSIIQSSDQGIEAINKVMKAAGFEVEYTGFGKNATVTGLTRVKDEDTINRSLFKDQQDKTKDRLKDLKDEKDRYHEINEIISDTERELDKLSKAKDRAFGASKLSLMQQEIDKQKELIKNNEQLLEEAKEYAKQDKQNLINNTAKGLNIEFDEYGRIANYEALQDSYIQRLRANAGNATVYENIEKEYENFKDAASKYEETLNTIEEEQNNLMTLRFDYEEKRLENIQTEIEDNIGITEDALKTLDYQLSKIEDDAYKIADAIVLIGKQTEKSVTKLEQYKTGIYKTLMAENAYGTSFTEEEVNKLLGGDASVLENKTLTSTQVEQLRGYIDNIYETNQQLEEYNKTVREKVVESAEIWNERLARQGELLEHNNQILENYRNIVDLVGADNLGISDEIMSQLNQQSFANADAALQAARVRRDQAKKAYEEAAAAGILNEEQLNTLYDAYLQAEEDFMGSWNNALEAAGNTFDTEVDRILKKFDDAMGGLEEKMDWFDKLQEKNEYFLKDYEQTYEISKLNRQISDSINNSENIKGQQALRDIQKELLAYEEEGKEMSKYDLEYLQKKYDLEMARIALEEAQNAKSQVRLRRDSEGNYGYVYTADQESVAKAEQSYEDKKYELEKFLDESSTEIQEQIMNWNQQMMEELGTLDKNDADYQEKAQRIVDHYTNLIHSLSDEGTEILQRGQEANEQYGTQAAETFRETVMGKIYTDINDYKTLNEQTQEAISQTLDDLATNHDTYQENVSKAFKSAGSSIDDFKNDAVKLLGEVDKKNKDLLKTTNSMASEMDKDFNAVIGKAKTFATNYETSIKPAIEAAEKLAQKISDVIAAYNNMPEAPQMPTTPKVDNSSVSGTVDVGPGGDGGSIPPLGDYSPEEGVNTTDNTVKTEEEKKKEVYDFIVNNHKNCGEAAPPIFSNNSDEIKRDALGKIQFGGTYSYVGYNDSANVKQLWYTKLSTDSIDNNEKSGFYFFSAANVPSNILEYLKSLSPDKNRVFKTGGLADFTGPAWLDGTRAHPELVLNAHDTENFLTAVQIVRSMSDQLEANARAAQFGINELRAASIPNSGTLEQNVHIEASFPNATNHNEIEEAFGNLVNLAAQYANRK